MPASAAPTTATPAIQRPEVLTFAVALKASAEYRKRHLLLGNGFSIACRPGIFRYQMLFDQADFSKLSASAHGAFEALGTTDFERVIKALRDTAQVLHAYVADKKLIEAVQRECDQLPTW